MATPDFRFQGGTFPIAAVAQILAQRPQREEELRRSRQQRRTQRLSSFLNILSTGAGVAGAFQQIRTSQLALEVAKTQAEAQKNVSQILAEPKQAAPVLQKPIQQFGPSTGAVLPSTGQVTPTFGQTERGATQPGRLQAAAIQAFPAAAGTALSKQIFDSEGGALEKLNIRKAELAVASAERKAATTGAEVDSFKKILTDSGITVPEGATAEQLARAAQALNSGKIAQARETMAETGQARVINDVVTRVNPNITQAVGMRRDFERTKAAGRLVVLAQSVQGNPINIQMRELSSGLASLVGGGGSSARIAEKLIDELTPKTLRGKINEQIQFITGIPTPLEQQEFVKLFLKTALREAAESEQIIRSTQLQAIRNLAGVSEKRKFQLGKDLGLSAKMIQTGKVVIDKDYIPLIPRFNPFKLTPEDIMTGRVKLTTRIPSDRPDVDRPLETPLIDLGDGVTMEILP